MRLRFLRMTIRITVKSKVKGVGQECPTHTIKIKIKSQRTLLWDIRIWALHCGPIHLGRLDGRMRPSPHEPQDLTHHDLADSPKSPASK